MKRLKNKYRLVILNETDFEEKASISIKLLNVLAFFSVIFITMFFIFYLLFGFTPMKAFLPVTGYSAEQKKVARMAYKVDSLKHVVNRRESYLSNIKSILTGEVGDSARPKREQSKDLKVKSEEINLQDTSSVDSVFKERFRSQDPYRLSLSSSQSTSDNLAKYAFFPPLKGMITSEYNEGLGHYAVDVVGPKDIGIKAVLSGTVIFSEWSASTGYVIMIQHPNNIVSVYKHNSQLLKKVGKFVEAGEVIAIIGESGELSTGPHLHFELWHNGNPINPQKYIAF